MNILQLINLYEIPDTDDEDFPILAWSSTVLDNQRSECLSTQFCIVPVSSVAKDLMVRNNCGASCGGVKDTDINRDGTGF